jgi:hypothetical protein
MVEICPDGPLGPPLGGIKQGDHWAPAGDSETSWAAIGSLYAEKRVCNDHVALFGSPQWDKGKQDFKGTIFCCGGDPPMDAPFTQAPTEAPPEPKDALPPPELNDGKDWPEVSKRLQYWHETDKLADLAEVHKAFKPDPNKYITFETDFGGFNNIRLGLEQVVLAAIVTGRTLVLPPKTGWYLIDWGPIQRDNKIGGKSRFHDFWDIPDLKKWIPVLEAEDFARKVRSAHADGGTGDGAEVLKQLVVPKPNVERDNGANNADQDR